MVYVIGLLLFFVHIVAFIAGGANSVVMPIIGGKLPSASPEVRSTLFDVADKLAKVGKYAMLALLVSGVLVLWLKWDFVIPNAWFWVKMALIVVMLVLIGMNEMNVKKLRAGDLSVAPRSKLLGQLTGLALAGVLLSALFAFN